MNPSPNGSQDTPDHGAGLGHDTRDAAAHYLGRAPLPSVADLLTPDDVAELLGVSIKTLANYRSRHTGPDYLHIGGRVYYTRSAYETYWNNLTGGAA